MPFPTDTIAAIATPLGEGGLSVIRVSGPGAIHAIADRFSGRSMLLQAASHTAHVGKLLDASGRMVDEVVCTVFRSPRSYTGEDVVEVSCHGGLLVTRRVLEGILESGVRHAAPGEFTRRAFLNGRMDLVQAEAVADLIQSSSDRAHRTTIHHLTGEYSARIDELRTSLVDALGLLELELDFAEDGYEFIEKHRVEGLIRTALNRVTMLAESFTLGKLIQGGVTVVIVGAANAGKSSLLNRLLKENRAIVTEIPGTTRDVVSESIMIDGVLFHLSDTAGLRQTTDRVEQEGVKRSIEKMTSADILLLVLDLTRPVEDQMADMGPEARDVLWSKDGGLLTVYNKADLSQGGGEYRLRPDDPPSVRISALTGEGLHVLEKSLVSMLPTVENSDGPEHDIVTNARHFEVFRRVGRSLELARQSLSDGRTGEFVAVDLRVALDGLGEITGKVTSEDVLNSVFSRFCIGK